MNLMFGAIGGMFGGLIGAIVWAAIVYFLHVEVGYVAWAIGGLVGFGTALGTKEGSSASAAIAVLITIIAICGGKYAAIHFAMSNELSKLPATASELSDEFCTSLLADEICDQKIMDGEKVNWPPGSSADTAENQGDYPTEIWTEAANGWSGMDAETRQKVRDEFLKSRDAALQGLRGQMANNAFLASFGLIDIIFFVLAIITAWRLAATDSTSAASDS